MIKVHYLRVLAAIGIIFLAACTESSSSSSTDPDSDLAVTAVADFTVNEGDTGVELGIKSSAGTISTYAWTQVNAGSNSVSISGSNTKAASFTAPSDLAAVTKLTFRITVSNSSDSKSDDVVITVNNTIAPSVTADDDFSVDEGTGSVSLHSTASGASSYKWEQINVGDYEIDPINNNDSESASFDPPSPLADGDITLTFQISVTDDDGKADSDIVEVTINDLEIPAVYNVFVSDDNKVYASDATDNGDQNYQQVSVRGETVDIDNGEEIIVVIGGNLGFPASVSGDAFTNVVDLSALDSGNYDLIAYYYGNDGEILAESDLAVLEINKDTTQTAPEIASITAAAQGDSSPDDIATDGIYSTNTTDNEVTITITAIDDGTGGDYTALSLSSDNSMFNGQALTGFAHSTVGDLSPVDSSGTFVDISSGNVDTEGLTFIYTATYTIKDGDRDIINGLYADGSEVEVDLALSDTSGNTGIPVTSVALDANVSVDANAPAITSVGVESGAFYVGDTMQVTINVSDDEDGLTFNTDGATDLFNGRSLTNYDYAGNGQYTATYTVDATTPDPNVASGSSVAATLQLKDEASNSSNIVSLVYLPADDEEGTASINTDPTNHPSVYGVVVKGGDGDAVVENYINDGNSPDKIMISGSTYGVAASSEVNITIGGVDLNSTGTNKHLDAAITVSVSSSPDGTFATGSNTNLSTILGDDGVYDVVVNVFDSDADGNAGLEANPYIGTVTLDTGAPSISSVTIPDELMGIGPVTATITLDDPEADDVSLTAGTIGGNSLSTGFLSGSGTTYEATFEIAETSSGDANVESGADLAVAGVSISDAAGNTAVYANVDIIDHQGIDATYPLAVFTDAAGGGVSTYTTKEGSSIDLNVSSSTDIPAGGVVNDPTAGELIPGGSYSWAQAKDSTFAELMDPATVTITPSSDGTIATISSLDGSLEILDDNGADGKLYFIVTIADEAGNEINGTVTLTVTNDYKNASSNFAVTPGAAPNFTQMDIAWTAADGFGYRLYRSTDSECGANQDLSDYALCDNSAVFTEEVVDGVYIKQDGTDASVTDTGLSLDTEYHYWLETYQEQEAGDVLVSVSDAAGNTTSKPQLNDTGVIKGADFASDFDTANAEGGGLYLTELCNGGYNEGNNADNAGTTNQVDIDGNGFGNAFVAFLGEDCEAGLDSAALLAKALSDDLADNTDNSEVAVATDAIDGNGYAGFNFTELDFNGVDVATSGESMQCVRDNNTGLVWEASLVDDDTTLRDKDQTFTWYDGTNGSDSEQTTQDLIDYLNGGHVDYPAGLCGITDWRLPTATELLSLANYSATDSKGDPLTSGDALVDATYLPKLQAEGNLYWTSTLDSGNTGEVWAYNSNGTIISDTFAGRHGNGGEVAISNYTSGHVILVSTGATDASYFNSWDNDRYEPNSNGTVVDLRTDLVWTRCAYVDNGSGANMLWDDESNTCRTGADYDDQGKFFWYEAFAQVAAARDEANGNANPYLESANWRLPNIKELYSLLDHAAEGRVNSRAFPNMRGSGFWSSTPHHSGGSAYYVSFSESDELVIGSAPMNGNEDYALSILLVREDN